jgi:Methyltransferase domain
MARFLSTREMLARTAQTWDVRRARRLARRATLHVADLAQPLSMCADASFDVIAGSLVLHYLERWEPTVGEFGRVLCLAG